MTTSRTVRAVLGPTNTGKTYLAIDRMLAHASGMIGFPLRLLARENYDRIVELKGRGTVALITGEEKIVPANPRWFVCTVESMPIDRKVDFLAVDEIQLCADHERGHVFTDRLLNSRGQEETMFLGADTIAPLLRQLVPEADIETRPRFSTLGYVGAKKLNRLPRRSAIVAFSTTEVYGLAEAIRRQRGGTAVVLGALSPRTRNAQVGMYQAGEVDYLVATDAIGMGLNMDIDHVAFAGTRKFDGRYMRQLAVPELAQIAGRAGRHMNDGTFGVTNNMRPFEDDTIEAIESHRFDPLTALQWRSRRLDFRSPQTLERSLERHPRQVCLVRVRDADDHLALRSLLGDRRIVDLAATPDMVRLLWEVCQVPDFRKTLADHHADLLAQLYLHLSDGEGCLPTDWVGSQIGRLDSTAGDIDTLTSRIAHVRTWAYVAHRGDWLEDSAHWQGLARQIEDRLSDALHARLIQRFVDQRAAVLGRKLEDGDALLSAVTNNGEVVVEGHAIGRIQGLRFVPDAAVGASESRAYQAAIARVIKQDAPRWIDRLEKASDDDFELVLDEADPQSGQVLWGGAAIAKLTKGDTPWSPSVKLLADDLPDGSLRARARSRLKSWADAAMAAKLRPLTTALSLELGPPGRGLVYRVAEGLGSIPRKQAQDLLPSIDKNDRSTLRRLGFRFGRATIYIAALLKPAALRLRRLLWGLWSGSAMPLLPSGRNQVCPIDGKATQAWTSLGFIPYGKTAIRADRLESILSTASKLADQGPFAPTGQLLAQLDGGADTLKLVLTRHGFAAEGDGTAVMFRRKRPTRNGARKKAPRRRKSPAPDRSDSPFAELEKLVRKK